MWPGSSAHSSPTDSQRKESEMSHDLCGFLVTRDPENDDIMADAESQVEEYKEK